MPAHEDLHVESVDDDMWDAFVASSPHGHLMQTSRWGAVKASFGWDAERVAVFDGDVLVAGAQVLYRSLPSRLGQLAYVPMGPVADWADAECVNALISGLRDAARRKGAFCLKVEPAVADGVDLVGALASHGFRPGKQTVQWRSTILVSLDCTEEEMLARLSSEHRRKVRKAAREGVTVRLGSVDDLVAFARLLGDTAERKDFAVYPLDYYRLSYDVLASKGLGQLFLAEYDGAVLAGVMVFTQGTNAYMMYAASGKLHRERYPAFLVHWEAICWARTQGCLVYDFCGIPDEVGRDPDRYAHDGRDDGMWGVYRFKRGFGGQIVGYVDTHDQVYSRPLYYLYSQAIELLQTGLGENWNRKLFSG